MSSSNVSLSNMLVKLEELVGISLKLWDIPENVSVELLNVSENFTYLITNSEGFKAVLRVPE